MSKPWFEERLAIFDRELNSFRDIGITFEIDEPLRQKGILRIKATINTKSAEFNLEIDQDKLVFNIVYPDSYPFFRPQVFADDLDLPRHQNPLEKNLCLLGRLTIEWDSQQTAAGLLRDQLPRLLKKAFITDQDAIKNDPTEQAEPVSEFYTKAEHPVLFDPSCIPEADLESNAPRLLASLLIGKGAENFFPTRLAVLETTVISSGEKHEAIKPIRDIFTSKFKGQLYRVPEPPPGNPSQMFPWLSKLLKANGQSLKVSNNSFSVNGEITIKYVTGLCFEEEKQKGVTGYGWLFHIEIICKSKPEKGMRQVLKTVQLYARSSDPKPLSHNIRAPKLALLADKKVSIAGLGALGGFIAIELARSGIGFLDLLDNDAVEPATTIRWPMGLMAVGINKVNILKTFVDMQYPGTKVEGHNWLLGTFQVNSSSDRQLEYRESDILDKFFENSSLVIDATAEFGVHHLLSQEAKKRGVPYISLYATPGAYGGSIMRQIPYKTGCWSCFTHMENDGLLLKLNEDATGLIQPPGCGDITFTGTSVDLQQISLMATKLAISTLCEGKKEGYPPVNWDVARVNLFSEKGEFLVPEWSTYHLPVHSSCYYCN